MSVVRVDLTVEIELSDWAHEYDIPLAEARRDVRKAAALVFQDWLRENMGFRAASVRVNDHYRMSGFRQ